MELASLTWHRAIHVIIAIRRYDARAFQRLFSRKLNANAIAWLQRSFYHSVQVTRRCSSCKEKPVTLGSKSTSKLFVIDTNVILHDANSIKNFKEHDVVIPIVVLEELDRFQERQ